MSHCLPDACASRYSPQVSSAVGFYAPVMAAGWLQLEPHGISRLVAGLGRASCWWPSTTEAWS